MATEKSPLLHEKESINAPRQSDDEAKSLRQVLADIRAGRVHIGPVLIYTLIAIIGSFMFGYVLGYSSLTEISISQDPNNTNKPSHVHANFTLSDDEFSYFGALAAFAALFAGLITGFISDKIGRKPSMLLGCLPLVFGWAIIAVSYIFIVDAEKQKFYAMLMVGRGLSGFGIGCLSLLVPTYIIEIAPTSLKGLLGAMHQLAITIGALVVYFVGSYLKYHYVAIIAGAIGVIYAVAILFIPETPRWLLVNGKEDKAVKALQRLRGRTINIEKEMDRLVEAIQEEGESTFAEKLMEFKKMPVIIALVLSLMLMFFQQFCGINAIIFYGANITASAHVGNPDLAFSLGIGLMQVVITFIGVILVDLVGRKKLLVSGGVLLLIGTALLGLYYFLCPNVHHHPYCKSISPVALVALIVFITGFSIGWGAIPWIMMSELAPLKVRGIMGGIATAVNWSFATIVTMFFSDYQEAVHPYGAWWSFAVVVFLSIPFVIFLLPETKGKTLEEIQRELRRYELCRSSRSTSSINN